MYLTPTERIWACDIEADNLLSKATRIWCVCVENVVTGEKHAFTEADAFRAWCAARPRDCLVGHNFIAYDLVMLNRFWNAAIGIGRVVDTFVLSQMYNPTLAGGHSLASWGQRLRHPKTGYTDFSRYTPEMLSYCRNDTTLTAKLFRRLSERMRSVEFTELGCEIEHLAWNIIQNKQRKHGFPFDYKRANELYLSLRAREQELQDEIYKLWPPRLCVVGEYKQCRKKDGDYTTQYKRHVEQYVRVEETPGGGYRVFDYVRFNLGSPSQRIAKLIELGWTPVQRTPKGSPKVDEDSLLAFAEASGKQEVKALAKWLVVNSRANMLFSVDKKGEEKGWLTSYNHDTGAIHGKLFIASTLRYRHNSPNTANIPAVRMKKDDDGVEHPIFGEEGAYGYECRDLWTCGDPEEFSLVGIDGTGIQNRCLIHSLIETVGEEKVAEFKELSLHGDIHKRNIAVLGLAHKAAAKKFFYCVPLDTLALTKTGWKKHDEVEVGDLVLTYNQELNIKEWQPVLEKVHFNDAPVVEMGHSRYRVRSTPNHRWFTQHRTTKTPSVTTTENMNTMQNIVVNAPMLDDWQPSVSEPHTLSKYGTDWVAEVLKMSQQERKAFLTGFCIADGYQDNNGSWRWSQLKGELFEAALLATYLVHDGMLNVSTRLQDNGNEISTVTLNKKSYVTTAHFEYTELPNQPVWCVRTENESWVMRQGDVITITGNTLMMGGGGARLAADQLQFGTTMTAKEGDEKKAALIASMPGFYELIERLENELRRTGRIKLCDGTPILVPSPHMVIPYKLQGDESRLMKQAMIYIDKEVRRHKLQNDVFKVADIHDEWQYKVRNEYVEDFNAMALPCFNRAGERFGYRIPIDGDAKVGKTWAMTH